MYISIDGISIMDGDQPIECMKGISSLLITITEQIIQEISKYLVVPLVNLEIRTF
jgi:hypothetical protein